VIKGRPRPATWTSRRGLAWALRLSTVVVPLVVAIVAMVLVAHALPRPRHGLLVAGWYVLLLAISYAASWATGKVMVRSLPLAALLEMSLTFPESAPSRLGLAQRGGSAVELARLATGPPDETTQNAAERILKLLTALSAHDRFTRGHAERVRAYTDLIAEKMSLPQAERERLRWAALLHDIGKLRVPATLLNKPGKPTAGEWDLLKAHPAQGSVIAAPLLSWLRPMDRVIAEHHEKFDGTGYPIGLSGEAISLGARIVTVADCFEAMTAVRSYSKPMKREAALAELVRCAGTQFDPVVVRALLAVPHRRLLLAMGPTAWLAGLPMVGQGSLGVVRTAVSHVGTAALSATAVAVAAIAPTSVLGSSAPTPEQTRLASVEHHVSPAAVQPTAASTTTGAVPATTHRAAPVPTRTSHPKPSVTPRPSVTPKPVTATHPAAPRTTAPTTAAPKTTAPNTSAPTTPKPTTVPTAVPTAVPITPKPTGTAAAPTTTVPVPVPAKTTTTAPTPVKTTAAPTTTPAPVKPTVTPTVPGGPSTTAAPTTTTTTKAALGCTATYTVGTSSKGTFQATITVTNTGTAIGKGWTVTWSFPTGEQKITGYLNASVSQSGKAVTATNTLLNGSGPAGSQTSFIVRGTGNPVSPSPVPTCVQH
jgi:HD-GYP domain-containing protein (c-di-GMP phosphodiesterase class II)